MRNPYACLYTSSYDRGLQHLLQMWPDVKKAVPQAELHIFYGWQLFEKFYHDNPASMNWKANMDKLMLADGITHHGRLPQPEIEKWYKSCGIWAYPTHFGEISCISAMKAQAWGAVPVVVDHAALQTTVQYGIRVKGDIYDQETKDEYKAALIYMLTHHDIQEQIRKEMMPWAQDKFTWAKIAKQWTDEFKTDELKEAMDAIISKKPDAVNLMPTQLQRKYGHKITS